MRIHENILIVFGSLIGFVVGIVFCVMLSAHKAPLMDSIFLRDGRLQWETLIGSVLALVAAGVTVLAMVWQAHEQRRRKRMAAFTALPLTLSELYDYNNKCLDLLSDIFGCYNNNLINCQCAQNAITRTPLSELPSGTVTVLRDCTEFADEDEAEALAALMGTLQVRNARMQSVIRSIGGAGGLSTNSIYNIRAYIVNSAEIDARLGKLLQLSRGDVGKLSPVCAGDIESKLQYRLFGIYNSDPHLRRMAEEWTPMLRGGN